MSRISDSNFDGCNFATQVILYRTWNAIKAYLDICDAISEIRNDEGRGLPVLPVIGARRDVARGQVVVLELGELVGDAPAGVVGAELGDPAPDLVLEEPGHVVERRQDEDGDDEEARPQVVLQPVEGEAQGHIPVA